MEDAHIHVCWENAHDTAAMHWASDAVKKSWEATANVHFIGWGACTAAQNGESVRIHVDDSNPRAFVGTGVPQTGTTMWLDFTFAKWSPSCRSRREMCIRAIAVHEFGHVLGFVHEQDRPEAPSSCNVPDARDSLGANGIELGAYDPHSIMNYCDAVWLNGGRLSPKDIAGVRKIYGTAG